MFIVLYDTTFDCCPITLLGYIFFYKLRELFIVKMPLFISKFSEKPVSCEGWQTESREKIAVFKVFIDNHLIEVIS